MLLPQKLNGLERYLSELPEKIEVKWNLEYSEVYLENEKVEIQYEKKQRGLSGLIVSFPNFIMPQKYELILFSDYNSNQKNTKVWGMLFSNENGENVALEIKNCDVLELIAKPENLAGASDFLNKVLDKYNFHSIYEEFEKLRLEEKRKKQQS